MKIREAECCCGKLEIALEGNPEFVVACNCIECQRRTGSVFAVSAYFKNDSIISKTADTATFVRESDAGKKLEFNFCNHCASTVWYEAEFMPGLTAVAVGCFGDPDFPSPQLHVWSPTKHPWVRFPPSSIPFKRQPSDIITAITLNGKLSRPYYWKDYLLGTFRTRKHCIRPDEEVCCLWREDLVDLISR